jgi:hypothetical protein
MYGLNRFVGNMAPYQLPQYTPQMFQANPLQFAMGAAPEEQRGVMGQVLGQALDSRAGRGLLGAAISPTAAVASQVGGNSSGGRAARAVLTGGMSGGK